MKLKDAVVVLPVFEFVMLTVPLAVTVPWGGKFFRDGDGAHEKPNWPPGAAPTNSGNVFVGSAFPALSVAKYETVVLPLLVTLMAALPLATVALPVWAPASVYESCFSAQASAAFSVTASPADVQQEAVPVTGVPPPFGVTV